MQYVPTIVSGGAECASGYGAGQVGQEIGGFAGLSDLVDPGDYCCAFTQLCLDGAPDSDYGCPGGIWCPAAGGAISAHDAACAGNSAGLPGHSGLARSAFLY